MTQPARIGPGLTSSRIIRIAIISTCLITALIFIRCEGPQEIIQSCSDERGIRVLCGYQNPEDLALAGDGHHVIVSQFGSMTNDAKTGNLAILDLRSESFEIVYRGTSSGDWSGGERNWGDDDCPGEPGPAFNPHGIDLQPQYGGRWRLLVVNHGGRESIEFFEAIESDSGLALEWRGCAIPPEGAFFNDVVNLPEGGFLATHMTEKSSPLMGLFKATLGSNTGVVYEWDRNEGFRTVPGTEAPFPNGIETNDDGSEIYLNVYGTGEVRRIDRNEGAVLATASVPGPDNSSWGRDGRLLVASHTGTARDNLTCNSLEYGNCPLAFEIVSLDPATLESRTVFSNSGPPMGAGTIAIDLGDSLLIGTYAGDRLIRVPWSRD